MVFKKPQDNEVEEEEEEEEEEEDAQGVIKRQSANFRLKFGPLSAG